MRLIHEIRAKYPGMAARADKGQRQACVRLFCAECYGGSLRDARTCPERDCPLWRAAGGAWSRSRGCPGGAPQHRVSGKTDAIGTSTAGFTS